jgi:anti-sigma factor RsiW
VIECPLPGDALASLVAGDLAEEEAAAAEAHVFSCDACGAAFVRLARLASALRDSLPPVLSLRQRDRLVAAGKRIVVTRATPESRPTARFAPGVDLLVHELASDLSRAERVDVDVVMPHATLELVHVPFDAASGTVSMVCQRHFEALGPTFFRVHAFEGGARRTVGEYFIEHLWA